jgi:calreticulin
VAVSAKTYFKETFDDTWADRWVHSSHKSDYGKFKLSHGKFFGDAQKDLGIQTSQDAHFYSISAKLDQSFSNKGEDLVVQFSVKHEQNLDCGGGYIKLLPSSVSQKDFSGDSPYYIMFGPDICGSRKVHVIINYKGENKLIKETILPESDVDTHVYTLIITPDNTYKVLIDNKEQKTGKLEDHWDFLPPKQIKDPNASKPSDWDDRAKIEDPTDTKPADWDSEPQFIADPEAQKPEDWDDELDGEWEAPQITNPKWKGEWTAKKIDNPNYKGVWVHPMIDNPEYVYDPEIYAFKDIGLVGFDLWQVKSGSIFDNIIVTNSVTEANEFYEQTTKATIEGEKAARKAHEEAEAEKAAQAAKANEEDHEEDFDEDDEDEHAGHSHDKDEL